MTQNDVIEQDPELLSCKAVWLLELFSLIVNMSRGNLLHVCLGTAIHNCSSSGSLFFTMLRWNNLGFTVIIL